MLSNSEENNLVGVTAVDADFNVCIISGGSNEGVRKRLEGLGISDVYLGAHNKIEQLNQYKQAQYHHGTCVIYGR